LGNGFDNRYSLRITHQKNEAGDALFLRRVKGERRKAHFKKIKS
jgi:hypothetical protein